MSFTKTKSNLTTTRTLVIAGLFAAISIILERLFSVMVPIAGLPTLRLSFGSIPLILSGIFFGPITGGIVGVISDLIGVAINSGGGPYFPGFTLSAFLRGFIPGVIYLLLKKKNITFDFAFINIVVILLLSLGTINLLFTRKVLTYINNKIYLYNTELPLWVVILFSIVVICFILMPLIIRKKREEKGIFSLDKVLFTVSVTYIIVSLILNTLWLSIMYKKGFMVFLPGRILSNLVTIPLDAIVTYTLVRILKKLV